MKADIFWCTLWVWMITGAASSVFAAKPAFRSYAFQSGGYQLLGTDFNGDGLEDIIIIDKLNLRFFFQDAERGFSETADQLYRLDEVPTIIWPAKLKDQPGQPLFVMTGEGVSLLRYADGTEVPEMKKIIDRKTIIPIQTERSSIIFFSLSANTAKDFPLVLVPTENALEIWKYENSWQLVGSIGDLPETTAWGPNNRKVGYIKIYSIDLAIGDTNTDGLDDLVVREDVDGRMAFRIYPQTSDNTFPAKPAQSFETERDWRLWTVFQDINRDGRIDMIRNQWLQEPGFIPGADSGKVVVQIFLAAADGTFPEMPNYLFRKSDWTPSMPLVDIDGDGFLDLVLGYGQFDSREGLRKAITSKKLDHTLRFHFYGKDGYRLDPDFETRITVALNYRGPIFTSRYGRVEDRISLDGDFNGDGRKDLLIKDEENRTSVYFFRSRTKGFSRRPDIQFKTSEWARRCLLDDLNRDGISDLVVRDRRNDNFTVFLSKRR